MATRKFKRLTTREVKSLLSVDGRSPKKSVEEFIQTTVKSIFTSAAKIKDAANRAGIPIDSVDSNRDAIESAIRSTIHNGIAENLSADDLTKSINTIPQLYTWFTRVESIQESIDKAANPPKMRATAGEITKPKTFNRIEDKNRKTESFRTGTHRKPAPVRPARIQPKATPKPKASPQYSNLPPTQVKAKYTANDEVTTLALKYCGEDDVKSPEHRQAMVNLFVDDLKAGKVPEELWPSLKYLKQEGIGDVRDIRLAREEYILSIRGEEVETTPGGLPLTAKQKLEASEKRSRISELQRARENIGKSGPKGGGIISSMMNLVPFGILQGVGEDLGDLLSSGKTYERQEREDRELKAKLKLEGVDVDSEDVKTQTNENMARIIADTQEQIEEESVRRESSDKWNKRGAKVASLFKSSPLQSINQSTTDAKQTILNSTKNTELTNNTVSNAPVTTNLMNVATSNRAPSATSAAAIAAANSLTTNNIVNSAKSIDPAKNLVAPPSMLSPESSSIEAAAEIGKDKSIAILGSIDGGIEKVVDLLSVIGPSLREEQPVEGNTGGMVEGIVDTVGSVAGGVGRGALMSGLGLAAAGTAAAVGVAGTGQALVGSDGVLRGGSGNNFINDAVGGRDWQKEDPKEVEARGKITLADINGERMKAGKEPLTAAEYEAARSNKSRIEPVAPTAKDLTPAPPKNAVLQQGIEVAQDRAIKLDAAAEAKRSTPSTPAQTTNNSTINNQSTTALSIRAQPKNNDSPWNRYQESRYQ